VVKGGVAFAVPGDLATPTGGYAYDRRMIAELERLGWQVDVVNVGEGFPRPTRATLDEALRKLSGLTDGQAIVIDGLAYGAMPDEARALSKHRALIALVHHPLALETGLSAIESAQLHATERAALAVARRTITTSVTTADLLERDYGVARAAITVAPPGTDRTARRQRNKDATVHLLAVGAVVPRKGYDVLVTALAALRDLPWRLTIVGALDRDPETAAELRASIARLDLASQVHVAGAVTAERLTELYGEADVFVLASRFEGYGMVFAEAMAHGLPVVGTTAGAIAETVANGAGLLVPPDDPNALAGALRRLISDPGERSRLAAAAGEVILPSWRQSAELFSQAIEAVR
jgi:glycosyltransferase involved in cell wall biosynthesis